MPSVVLRSTRGKLLNVAEASQHRGVFFFYPHTGRPGDPITRDWDLIPGARGCTPQNCGFRDHYQEFRALAYDVFGVSGQGADEEQGLKEQIEFAERVQLPYELLNDSKFQLTDSLRLPTFNYHEKRFIKRLALVVESGRIHRVFYPVFPPDRCAAEVLSYLRDR